MTRRQIREAGGQQFLALYPSLSNALAKAYPDTKWDSSRFVKSSRPGYQMPSGYWDKVNNQQHFLKRIGKELGIQQVILPKIIHFDHSHLIKAIRLVRNLTERDLRVGRQGFVRAIPIPRGRAKDTLSYLPLGCFRVSQVASVA